MSNPPAPADRAARVLLLVAFWVPLGVCTWLALTPSPPESVFRVSDIVLHAGAFGYLTFAAGLAYPTLLMPALGALMLGYGIGIELVQSVEPTRSAEVKDLLVDAAGILVGLGGLYALGGWSRRTLRALLDYPFGGA